MENKICPLLSIGEQDLIKCRCEHCAWFVPPMSGRRDGHCAVQDLGALPVIASGVGRL